MKSIRTAVALGILCCAATLTTGCFWMFMGAAAGAGYAGAAYVSGELKDTLSAPVETVHSATVAALPTLGLPIMSEEHDVLNSEVKSHTAANQPVTVKSRRVTDTATEVTIRVGNFGDKAMSIEILDAIKSKADVK